MQWSVLLTMSAQQGGGAAAGGASSSGPLSASIATDLGDNFDSWVNVNNVFASDDSYATVNTSFDSNTLRVRGFGFAIPGGAAILGVKFEVEAKHDVGTGRLQGFSLATDNLGDTTDEIGTGTGAGDPAVMTASDAYYTIGGATDLWGATLTPAIVNSANFSVDFFAHEVVTNQTFSIDHVRMTIYYT